jgi:nucleoside-diphosphate-sugar epimerase
MLLLAEHGEPGSAYNICSDTAHRIGDLIELFERSANLPLMLEPDPSLFRPSDEAVIFGRNDRLKQRTGWRQTVSIDQTVQRVLEYEVAHAAP